MTTRDRTERHLLSSIRKAKTGDTAESTQPVVATQQPPTQEQPAAASPEREPSSMPRAEDPRPDPYQLGRRVWPD